jgi:DNA-directed RNA polymerase alpha subunit
VSVQTWIGLPTQTRNRLRRAGIRDVGDLLARSEADLIRLRGIGMGTLRQIRAWTVARGLPRRWWEARHDDPSAVQSRLIM